ncbi:hypothetical protein KH5H1_56700 [Corallococcus caeni]|uniref:hypothetical protein n=1 Tax=Corallococcus caeni TaxID=3082388 RepID=UPI002956550E|nr:hypothetical protein KH5H1_56700 [Corallococcus sp. KH5-1]
MNVAHAVGNAKLAQAVADRTPVVLADEPAVDVGSDFNAATGFGNGVALARGANSAGIFDVTDVSRRRPLLARMDSAVRAAWRAATCWWRAAVVSTSPGRVSMFAAEFWPSSPASKWSRETVEMEPCPSALRAGRVWY